MYPFRFVMSVRVTAFILSLIITVDFTSHNHSVMHLNAAQVCTAAVAYRSVRIVNALCVWDFTAEIPVQRPLERPPRTQHATSISLPLCQH